MSEASRIEAAVELLYLFKELGDLAGSVLAAHQAASGLTSAHPENALAELEARIRELAGRTDELEDTRKEVESALVVLRAHYDFRSLADVLKPLSYGGTRISFTYVDLATGEDVNIRV